MNYFELLRGLQLVYRVEGTAAMKRKFDGMHFTSNVQLIAKNSVIEKENVLLMSKTLHMQHNCTLLLIKYNCISQLLS